MLGEEYDTLMELIFTIMFFSFAIFATSYMVAHFTPKIAVAYESDKLTTINADDAEDNHYYSGYQAYMMAWHMDSISEEPVMWISDDSTRHNPGLGDDADNDTCDSNDTHVILSLRNRDTGEIRSSFINWRNRHITGALLTGTNNSSVQKMINASVPASELQALWFGTHTTKFHLEYSYANMESSGSSGKESIWQLRPVTP